MPRSLLKTVAIACAVATAFLLLAILLLVLVPGIVPRSARTDADRLSSAELALLRDGDIVLRQGNSLPSSVIATLFSDGTNLSHCAFLYSRPAEAGKPPEFHVIHTLNGSFNGVNGVQSQRFEDFCRDNVASTLVVVRPKVSPATAETIRSHAEKRLADRLPFDNSYDLQDRGSLYCSELLVDVFETAGWHIGVSTSTAKGATYAMSGPVISFQTFLQPAWFDLVLSHNPAVKPW